MSWSILRKLLTLLLILAPLYGACATYPDWDDTVRNRVEAILSREGPPSLNMEVLIKRRIVGEDI